MISPVQAAALLRTHISELLDIDPDTIEENRDLDSYGLDSADAVVVAGALEGSLECEIEPSLLLRNRTIAAVVADMATLGLVG